MKNVINNKNTSLPYDISEEVKNGMVLVGDDFNVDELKTWFMQEQEAFYEVNDGNSDFDPWYAYMRFINEKLGFSKVQVMRQEQNSILVFGPGSGIEIDRFASENRDWNLCFLEASEGFKSELKEKYPQSRIVDPLTSGDISLSDESQNIICAFSVLHHIPNVSHVIREAYRLMKPGGFFLVREPCSSMGDWRFTRAATPNERGISRLLLTKMAEDAGFTVEEKPVPISFAPLNGLFNKISRFPLIPTKVFYWFDRTISWIVSLNDFYWRDTEYKKIGPSAYFYVFKKPNV